MSVPFGSNCHTHTLFCDGKASAEEMIQAAIGEGFVSLGFSGHSPLPYENDWAMKEEDLPLYLKTLADLGEKYQDKIEIVSGIEQLDQQGKIGAAKSAARDCCAVAIDHFAERSAAKSAVCNRCDLVFSQRQFPAFANG